MMKSESESPATRNTDAVTVKGSPFGRERASCAFVSTAGPDRDRASGDPARTAVRILTILAVGVAVALPAWAHHSDEHAGQKQSTKQSAQGSIPEAIADLEIFNARMPDERLLTAGQITPAQMTVLHELGYDTFISLRSADEQGSGWEEEAAGEGGLRFIRIPIAGAAGITRENAAQLAQQIPAAGEGRTVVYCGSGNRVGALLALKAHFVDGLPAQDALDYGLAAGLTRLEPVVRERLALPAKEP